MNEDQARIFFDKFLLGKPTGTELEQCSRRLNQDGDSWVWLDERVFEESIWNRKHMVLYSSCHGWQMRYYIHQWRHDVLNSHFVHIVFNHQLMLDKHESVNRITRCLFWWADIILCNWFTVEKFGQFSCEHLFRLHKPDCKIITFVPPTSACWWPCVVPFGEDGVIAHMKMGLSSDDIIERFEDGTFDPQFGKRFKEQMDNLALREKDRDVKLSDFVIRNHKKAKMFHSFNHPTYHVITYLTNRLLGVAGFPEHSEDHALSVGVNESGVGASYPESDYEWDWFGFEYPKRFTDTRGGVKEFYHSQIRQSYAKQKALTEPEYINPLDDL